MVWRKVTRWFRPKDQEPASRDEPRGTAREAAAPTDKLDRHADPGSFFRSGPIPQRSRDEAPGNPADKLGWLADPDNPFGVPVVDLRPFALTVLSLAQDPRIAANAGSYGNEDGTGFVEQQPPSSRVTECALRFRIDRVLLEGSMFRPGAMEDKWAIYFHNGRILCLRSWRRLVLVSAAVRIEGEHAVIGPITGTFNDDETPEMTVQQLEFLLRSHVLGEDLPAPLANEPLDLRAVAGELFSMWGRRALYATHHPLPPSSPVHPLRTDSLLIFAVVRGDRGAVERQLAQGAPFDTLARDGNGVPHCAMFSQDRGMLAWLLDRGCPVDLRTRAGETPLMRAVQDRSLERVRLLVERAADVNAQDTRGFTSLHRAAEMGELEIVRVLLERGAKVSVEARGLTPLALAERRKEAAVVALLAAYASD